MASIKKRANGKWRVRWRDYPGRGAPGHVKDFTRKADADAFKVSIEATQLDGTYVDPRASRRTTFRDYAEGWRERQVHRDSTAAQLERNLRRHVYPRLGNRPIGAIRPSDVQAMVKAMSIELAPSSVGAVMATVGSIFKAAVADRVMAMNPCEGVNLPPVERRPVVPLAADAVLDIAEGVNARYSALVILGAGTGVRISEALAVTADRIDREAGTLLVDRQLQRTSGPDPVFGPVKDRYNRPRTIPLPRSVVAALAAHQLRYGLGPEGLIFTAARGGKVTYSTFARAWRRAADPLGITEGEGFHQLRHFYASALIEAGESVKVVQSRLGHASATMTLDIYGHLWPDTEDRTRRAVDALLAPRVDLVWTAGAARR